VRHERRLAEDPGARLLEGLRGWTDADAHLGRYLWESVSAPPFAIFWTDGTTDDRGEMDRLAPAERATRWAALDARRATWRRALAEKAAVLPQLHAEFLRRYGDAIRATDLTRPWGGRPDLPTSKRSYRDGYSIAVFVFGSRAAWTRHHVEGMGDAEPLRDDVGYATRRAYLVEDETKTRAVRLSGHLRVATHAILAAYASQRNEWGPPRVPSTLRLAVGAFLGSASLDRDRRLSWGRPTREELDSLRSQDFHVVPLRILPESLPSRATEVQGGALAHFLDQGSADRMAAVGRWISDSFDARRSEDDAEAFARALGLRAKDDWDRLDREVRAWFPSAWLALPEAALPPPVPELADWPSYREPR
jgi:hypothetical protein